MCAIMIVRSGNVPCFNYTRPEFNDVPMAAGTNLGYLTRDSDLTWNTATRFSFERITVPMLPDGEGGGEGRIARYSSGAFVV